MSVIARLAPRPKTWSGQVTAAVCALVTLTAGAAQASALRPSSTAASAGTAAQGAQVDRTSAAEARRVDSVPAPRLRWASCPESGTLPWKIVCTTVRVPLDYDNPQNSQIELAITKVSLAKPGRRIGTLFVNPGGPGGIATSFAAISPSFLGQDVLDRFDVVGIDPRGIGRSANVVCFRNQAAQDRWGAAATEPFPVTAQQTAEALVQSSLLAKACSSAGRPLSAFMTTADVARDMDVIRRTVGDSRLTFLGFSYGSVLGQTYAAMFPDRVRAIAVDGVVDAELWYGTAATASRPSTDRLLSGEGADGAARELLARCDAAGAERCSLAGFGKPAADAWSELLSRLRDEPVWLPDGTWVSYNFFIQVTLQALYRGGDVERVLGAAELVYRNLVPRSAADRAEARAQLARQWPELVRLADRPVRAGFPYNNSADAYTSVICSETRNPSSPGAWPNAARTTRVRSSWYSLPWLWSSASCARENWQARGYLAYRGPFKARTASGLLTVGNTWDPATNWRNAVSVAKAFPGSSVVLSDSWGHTAYQTSACVTEAVDAYLVALTHPAKGTRCTGDFQPFTDPAKARTSSKRPIVPVAPFLPGALGAGH